MKPAIQTKIKGIKCDAPACTYRDNSVGFDQYAEYLNKPCPKCGANLLTQADLDFIKTLLDLSLTLSEIIGPVESSEPETHINFEFDGSGIPKTITFQK